MSQYFHIHPDNPQSRLIRQAAEIIRNGGVVAYPTDSAYALGCHLGDKDALERIRRLRQLDDKHNFTLICRDLSELGVYAKVDNQTFRLLKASTPGSLMAGPATSNRPRLSACSRASRKCAALGWATPRPLAALPSNDNVPDVRIIAPSQSPPSITQYSRSPH